jgi:integrase
MQNETETLVAVRGPRHPSARRKTRGLMQDKRGRWWIDYRTPEGKRRRKLHGTHEAAKTALGKIDLAKRDRTYTDPHASPTFKEFSETYLKTVSIHKKSHDRETWLMKNLTDFFGTSKLCKIERSRILEFRIARLKSVSKATVNREISLLRHMFNVAIDQNFLGVNPARGGIGMKAFKELPRERYLEMVEVESVLTAIQTRIAKNSSDPLKTCARKSWQYLHTAVVMALHTGMRKGEILGLKWENVNWERKTVLLTDTKNGESRRLPIDAILLHELSEHRTRVKNEELVFPSFDRNGNVVPLNDVSGSFDKALSDVGIKNFRFHDLRHTFASHYMMSGGELYTLSKILGHKDLKMTQRYAKLSSKFIEGERDRMDTIWTPAPVSDSATSSQTPTKYLQ